MNEFPIPNLELIDSNRVEMQLEPMILVPLMDHNPPGFQANCSCGSENGCGAGGSCLCGSASGCGR